MTPPTGEDAFGAPNGRGPVHPWPDEHLDDQGMIHHFHVGRICGDLVDPPTRQTMPPMEGRWVGDGRPFLATPWETWRSTAQALPKPIAGAKARGPFILVVFDEFAVVDPALAIQGADLPIRAWPED